MSDSTPTSGQHPSVSPVKIAATGNIPADWSAEIRRRAIGMTCRFANSSSIVADELEVRGRTALWLAARAYDSDRGVPFERYARKSIRYAMVSGLRFLNKRTGATKAISLDDPGAKLSPCTEDDALLDEVFALCECKQLVQKWVATCPPRLQLVFDLVYVRGLNQREAAVRMGISQPRVSQYHRQLLELGRKNLALAAAA